MLVSLAQQFGYATGSGKALRSAIGDRDKKLYTSVTEVHERGSILVAAVFDAFFAVYERRIRDLIRIATGGTGNLPDADLHPDLVNRIAREASSTAEGVLRMCIRAFDYLAPVDITFGDYLRALVTADYELNPADEYGLRAEMIEGFRVRGIYPEGVTSLAEEALLWPVNPNNLPALDILNMPNVLASLVDAATAFSRRGTTEAPRGEIDSASPRADEPAARTTTTKAEQKQLYGKVYDYAVRHAADLGLDPSRVIAVHGLHPTFRVGRNGRLLVELVIQFVQTYDDAKSMIGGLPFRAGTTVVFTADGKPRYVVAKPSRGPKVSGAQRQAGRQRFDRQRDYAELCALGDPQFSWKGDQYADKHMALRMNLAAIHSGAVK